MTANILKKAVPQAVQGWAPLIALAILPALLSACHRDMYEQPKILPDQQSNYFPQLTVDRQPPAHSVSRGAGNPSSPLATGQAGGNLVTTFPVPVNETTVQEGRMLFDINCSACHGRDGYGHGMIVQRGFPQPPSLLEQRLRDVPVGHFFVVMTQGYGAMYPFASRLTPTQRWQIASYIRALQFSQRAPANELEDADRRELEKLP